MGFIDWWGHNVSHTDNVSIGDMLWALLLFGPFVLAWVVRNSR